jgi:hypothetical protein
MRRIERRLGWVFALAGFCGAVGSAGAAEIRIADVKAYLFLEQAGKLSDDILSGPPLVNAPRGGAPGGDTATTVLLDFAFEGEKNASPKYATATVDLTQTNYAGQRIVTHKAFTGFLFGPEGVEHKALFLDGSTCMPLDIDIRAGKTHKTVRLDFQCDLVHAEK